MTKKKKQESGSNKLMGAAKDTMGLGVVSMAGMGAMGAMGSIPGMPAAAGQAAQTAGVGFNLLNVGQMAKNAMLITDVIQESGAPKEKKKKSTGWL